VTCYDVFFLAYGVLHWNFWETWTLPFSVLHEFVEALERQIVFEREEQERGSI